MIQKSCHGRKLALLYCNRVISSHHDQCTFQISMVIRNALSLTGVTLSYFSPSDPFNFRRYDWITTRDGLHVYLISSEWSCEGEAVRHLLVRLLIIIQTRSCCLVVVTILCLLWKFDIQVLMMQTFFCVWVSLPAAIKFTNWHQRHNSVDYTCSSDYLKLLNGFFLFFIAVCSSLSQYNVYVSCNRTGPTNQTLDAEMGPYSKFSTGRNKIT